MSAAAAAPANGAAGEAVPGQGGRKRLLLLAIPLVLAAVAAGLWFGGILPPLLGMGRRAAPVEAAAGANGARPETQKADAHGATRPDAQAARPVDARSRPGGAARAPGAPIFAELPDIIANLNGGPRRTVYVKLRAKLELAKPEDEALVQAAMPRLLDLFQTYLREMRPEELRSSAGTYRLREELLARANIALAPARAQDLLFTEILIQ